MNSLRYLIQSDEPNRMNIPLKETLSDTKKPLFAGVDVGVEELVGFLCGHARYPRHIEIQPTFR